jgi:hypothetical protein
MGSEMGESPEEVLQALITRAATLVNHYDTGSVVVPGKDCDERKKVKAALGATPPRLCVEALSAE